MRLICGNLIVNGKKGGGSYYAFSYLSSQTSGFRQLIVNVTKCQLWDNWVNFHHHHGIQSRERLNPEVKLALAFFSFSRGASATVQHTYLVFFLLIGTCSKQLKLMIFFYRWDCYFQQFQDNAQRGLIVIDHYG